LCLSAFSCPTRLCFTEDGTLLIPDFDSKYVYEFEVSGVGKCLRTLGGDVALESGPTGVCANRDIVVITLSDSASFKVVVVDYRTGMIQNTFGTRGKGPGSLEGAQGLCLSPDGRFIIVADPYNNRVSVYTVDGKFVSSFGDALKSLRPFDVCITACGHFAVVYPEAHVITLYAPDTFEPVVEFRPSPVSDSEASAEIGSWIGERYVLPESRHANPYAIAYSQGKLYSLEAVSNRVEVFE
jgi:DNA-binding beta-propeller fold protein YncE